MTAYGFTCWWCDELWPWSALAAFGLPRRMCERCWLWWSARDLGGAL
jgi:hypothetical protein